MAKIKRELIGYSDDPTFDTMMYELGWLAGEWRETKDDKYIKRYHILYHALMEMGCEDELDLELLLPFELMPKEYFEEDEAEEELAS